MNSLFKTSLLSLAVLLPACAKTSSRSAVAVSDAASPYWIKIRSTDGGTEHKRIPVQSSELERGTETCRLDAGALIELSSAPMKLQNGHYLINRANAIPGCSFSSGFVYAEHVVEVSATVVEQKSDGGGFKVKAKTDAWFKRGTGSPDSLALGAEKCTLHYGETVEVQGTPLLFDESLYLVNLSNMIPGCSFSVGLVDKEEIEIISPMAQGIAGATDWGRRLAQLSYDTAAVIPGSGRCYYGVAQAFAQAGMGGAWGTYGIPGNSAYQFGRWANANPGPLETAFRLRRANVSPWDAPTGSLFVYEPGFSGAHPVHGHIEIKVNANVACSDYCGSIYRQPSYIYVPL